MAIRCVDIHDDGCSCELEDSWAFCPSCGRKTGGLNLSSPTLRFLAGQESGISLPLNSRGGVPVRFRARLNTTISDSIGNDLVLLNPSGVEVSFVDLQTRPGQTAGLRFRWKGKHKPPWERPLLAALEVESDDGEPKDPFETSQGNRRRIWDTTWLQVSSSAPPRLTIETQLALFSPRLRERIVTLRNDGDVPLSLRPFQSPIGYDVTPVDAQGQPISNTFIIRQHSQRHWKVRALPSAEPGVAELDVRNSEGLSLGSIILLNEDADRIIPRTRFVVGIDFGTSGTSVWRRSGEDNDEDAIPLRDLHAVAGEDPLRFPTLIYVDLQDGHETGFYIGYAALRAYEKAGTKQGFLIRELKSALRRDDEPYVKDFGSNYTIDILLRRYLETLKKQIINPAIEGGDKASVAWNFSLPVLDSHRGGSREVFEKQKSRLDKGIRAAGYLAPNCTLQFFTEPYCAAIYLLLGYGKYRFPDSQRPKENQWVCVFDSGGGTTDVVLGRLWYDSGQLRFEEVSTLGGHHTDDRTQEVTTFGGESVTRRTAIYLSVWNGRKHDYLKDAQFAKLDAATYSRLMDIAERAARDENALLGQSRTGEFGDDLWVKRTELLRETDKFKRQIASLGVPSANVEIRIASAIPGVPERVLSIRRSEFDAVVVNPRLKPIGEEMKRRVFGIENESSNETAIAIQNGTEKTLPPPVDVTWVFGVGGNCRTKQIEDWLNRFFPSGIQELTRMDINGQKEDSDRMLAVAGGAVWASKARRDDALPYALRIQDEGSSHSDPVFEVTANDSLSDAVDITQCVREIPPGQRARFTVWAEGTATSAGGSLPFGGYIGAFELVNADSPEGTSGIPTKPRSIAASFSFERRRLIVKSDETGEPTEKFNYPIG